MYRALLDKYPQNQVHFTVIMPEPIAEEKNYLSSLGLPVVDTKQVDFAQLGILGTPTLMVLDRSGQFRCGWSGFMSDSDQKHLATCLDKAIYSR